MIIENGYYFPISSQMAKVIWSEKHYKRKIWMIGCISMSRMNFYSVKSMYLLLIRDSAPTHTLFFKKIFRMKCMLSCLSFDCSRDALHLIFLFERGHCIHSFIETKSSKLTHLSISLTDIWLMLISFVRRICNWNFRNFFKRILNKNSSKYLFTHIWKYLKFAHSKQ